MCEGRICGTYSTCLKPFYVWLYRNVLHKISLWILQVLTHCKDCIKFVGGSWQVCLIECRTKHWLAVPRKAAVMDVSGLVQYNSEGGKINSIFSCFLLFFQNKYRVTSISVQLCHFPAARTLGSECLQPAKQTGEVHWRSQARVLKAETISNF